MFSVYTTILRLPPTDMITVLYSTVASVASYSSPYVPALVREAIRHVWWPTQNYYSCRWGVSDSLDSKHWLNSDIEWVQSFRRPIFPQTISDFCYFALVTSYIFWLLASRIFRRSNKTRILKYGRLLSWRHEHQGLDCFKHAQRRLVIYILPKITVLKSRHVVM